MTDSPIFSFKDEEPIGVVEGVDTGTAVIDIPTDDKLRLIQVNQLVVIQSPLTQHHIIGLVSRISRDVIEEKKVDGVSATVKDSVKVTLIGTLVDKVGVRKSVFRRSIASVPQIGAKTYQLEGERLTAFMSSISAAAASTSKALELGTYALDERAPAYLDGNALFARHVAVVGSTGSGKSWTVARLLEQVAELPMANAILFDLHGEYSTLTGPGFTHLRIAGPNDDKAVDGVIFLPYWLLTYEEMTALLLDRSDQNAPNQAMLLARTVADARRMSAKAEGDKATEQLLTVDSPVPYSIKSVIDTLSALDSEMVPGKTTDKQGPFHGKLTRFLQRLEAKMADKRLNFLFGAPCSTATSKFLVDLLAVLMSATGHGKPGVKIINFTEVPSDVLPLMVGLVARLVFTVQMWMDEDKRVPIALFCDEAHLYLPNVLNADSAEKRSVYNFERIAKEGRKYGVSLVVISQRPSEINHTILSQCGNFVAMRLSNAEDQSVVKKLLPDSLAGLTELLPVLDVGEALAVGDACLLPSRIRIHPPTMKPISSTKKFWDLWSEKAKAPGLEAAITALRRQSKPR
jgi:hypothetical protein